MLRTVVAAAVLLASSNALASPDDGGAAPDTPAGPLVLVNAASRLVSVGQVDRLRRVLDQRGLLARLPQGLADLLAGRNLVIADLDEIKAAYGRQDYAAARELIEADEQRILAHFAGSDPLPALAELGQLHGLIEAATDDADTAVIWFRTAHRFNPAQSLGKELASPRIEMRLELPDSSATAAFDLTCVGAVKVQVIGNPPGDGRDGEVLEACFDVDVALRSFDDVRDALAGQFTFDLPRAGLAGVELTGFAGRCSDNTKFYESVFYGGAPRMAGTTMVIPVRQGVSCDAGQSYKVRALHLGGLYASYATQPTGATCAAPDDPISLFAGVIRPRMLGDQAPRMMLEYGSSSVATSDGTGKLQSFRPVRDDPACVALGYRGTASRGVVCVGPPAQARGLCGAADEVEVPELAVAAAASFDTALMANYGNPVIGAVWSTFRVPIAGATVELADPSQGKVVYVNVSLDPGVPSRVQALPPAGSATSTTASGAFIVYLHGEATNLVVKAPNYVAQTLRIASVSDALPTLIVVLAQQTL